MGKSCSKRPRWLAAAVLLALVGCGGGTGEVSGIVTLDGKPLPGGMVAFIPENGSAKTSPIKADGSYLVSNVPVGPARITVVTVPPVSFGNAKPNLLHGEYVPIPKKYGDPRKSGLALDVTRGKQEYNLPLMP